MLFSQVGEPTSDGRAVNTKAGDAGFAVYGPYSTLTEGRYFVDFPIRALEIPFGNPLCCKIDICVNGQVLVEKHLYHYDLVKNGCKIRLDFSVVEEGKAEFRVYVFPEVPLAIGIDRPVTPVLGRKFNPLSFFRKKPINNNLFINNISLFKEFEAYGVAFNITDDTVIATCFDTRFFVTSAEDFQLIGEIFFINEYNVLSGRPKIFVDIGMNAGLTSLYAARIPSITQVLSFEPFATPFNRALQNFALNPVISKKITPNHFGFSDKNEKLNVNSQINSTISSSIRGLPFGEQEIIDIRDAGEVLNDVISSARAQDLEVIMKIDCEGSEFAIFGSLAKCDLLSKIDVFMIEWHKWWSVSQNQFDLVNPLIEKDFFIIDRTDPRDPHAGFFYAVRRRG